MSDAPIRDLLLRQFETACALTAYHLDGLTTEECLWRPASRGLHVHRAETGRWRADWPDHEGYDLGPSSIAWTTWHILFWWSMALDSTYGPVSRTHEEVDWPGTADGVRAAIENLQTRWRSLLEQSTDLDLMSHERTRWPIQDRPFSDIAAWVNLELMKNASEIGLVRFLYAVRTGP